MLTVADVAALLHLTPWTVRKMARLGKIPGRQKLGKSWLFRRHDIQRFVEGKPSVL